MFTNRVFFFLTILSLIHLVDYITLAPSVKASVFNLMFSFFQLSRFSNSIAKSASDLFDLANNYSPLTMYVSRITDRMNQLHVPCCISVSCVLILLLTSFIHTLDLHLLTVLGGHQFLRTRWRTCYEIICFMASFSPTSYCKWTVR